MSQQPQQQYSTYPVQQPQGQPQQYSTYPAQNQYPQQTGVANPPKNISNDDLLLYILGFFCPPLGIYWMKGTCDQDVLITLVLWFLFWFPGFIYAWYLILQRHKQLEQEKNPQHRGMA